MKSNKIRLGEQCVVTSSKRFHLSERITQGVPFYCSKEIIKKFNGEDVTECDYISEDLYKKVSNEVGVPKENDLLITTRGTIGIPYLYKRTDRFYFADGNLTWIKDFDSNLYSKFLYYWFQSYEGRKKFEALAKGTAQKAVPISGIKTLEIELPSLKSQKRIADILSAYDDLIENNQKQIKLLEEAAQRLYKEWFVDLRFPGHENTKIVDGVPEGWNWCKLEDAIQLDPKVTLTKERMKQFIPMSALSTASMVLDESQFTETTSNSGSKFQNGDTLLARITPCLENGKTAYVSGLKSDEGAVGSTEYIVMRAKTINSYMVYLLARTDDFRQSAINSMSGSDGRQRVKSDKLKMLDYLHPTSELVEKFENVEEPIFEKIYRLSKQMQQAKQARDLLLPKLMSGEVEV